MSRQLFIHHYLPAHLASACLAGSILNFILTESINYPVSAAGPTTRLRPRIKAVVPRKAYFAFGILSFTVIGMFIFLAPFTYGTALCVCRRTVSRFTLDKRHTDLPAHAHHLGPIPHRSSAASCCRPGSFTSRVR